MAEEDIDKLLERHMEENLQNGDGKSEDSDSERRKHSRIKADATTLTVRAEVQVAAIDVSLSGLAFYSQFPVQVGQHLYITVGDLFTVEAEVVFCKLEDADPDFMETHYKIQCRFFEEEQGKYLLVMVKEMDKKRKEEG